MSVARYAAFLRNVNLGRTNSPTRDQLEAAFLAAGAATAQSFQVNGTLVFTPARGTRPRALAARACEALAASCGMREPVFVRSVDELRALVASDPFAGQVADGRDACCISFLGAPRKPLPTLPLATPRGDLELLRADDTHVLSVSRWVGASAGSPNAWLERTLGELATTRNWRTVVRLVEKYS
ncbi:DUF1697 domain-containing protein [Scleromatobacter humisilvae]|uniref:DUF1697 domain-containing protein n=1 Tax=Scleromatobacter humisilvae TaxID=2897159 RepID=A0A9X1YI51_9BURK|nr:DUF1697 domain-containing protein [Scleromatobacter humisilvae]MCK9685183.1 DUF1697 domain-containing protein [Scleromatobacter humisilvae]